MRLGTYFFAYNGLLYLQIRDSSILGFPPAITPLEKIPGGKPRGSARVRTQPRGSDRVRNPRGSVRVSSMG